MIKIGSNIFLKDPAGDLVSKIPVGNWMLKFDPQNNHYFIVPSDPFVLPDKIYGDQSKYADRYIKSFNTWEGNLGIHLTGLKGTGKSLLAKEICIKAGLPVILITAPYAGPDFIQAISKIKQPAIIFIDEFEKVYERKGDVEYYEDGGLAHLSGADPQKQLLSLLDGAFNSKFMFILTSNESASVSPFLKNRPGRIHYRRKYQGMGDDMIKEIADDLLENKELTTDLVRICKLLGNVSMDIIISIIKESNLYPEDSLKDIVQGMSLEAENSEYKLRILKDGLPMDMYPIYTKKNPLGNTKIGVNWPGENKDTFNTAEHEKGECWNRLDFNIHDAKVSQEGDNICIQHQNYTLIYERSMRGGPLWSVL
jgi:hypothetical protein